MGAECGARMGFDSAGTNEKPFLTVRNVLSINWKELGEGVCEASGKGFWCVGRDSLLRP